MMSQTKTRAWVAGTVVFCLLLSVAAWFLLISPNRANASEVRAQTASVQSANDQTRVRIQTLQKQFANLQEYQKTLADLRVQMPATDRLAELTRYLNKTASDSGVTLNGITPSTPTAVAAPAATAATPSATATAASSESTGSGTAAATTASSGLVSIPVVVEVTGDYAKSLEFLKILGESDQRNLLVTQLAISDPTALGSQNAEDLKAKGQVTMRITGSVFALPDVSSTATASSTAAAGAAATGSNN